MIIKKLIRFPLDVANPVNIYSDPDNNLKSLISSKIAGTCRDQCLILSVDRIVKRGECVISKSTEPYFGTVPVIIEVTAYVVSENEIINGLIVKNIGNDGVLLAGNEYITCIIRLTSELSSIKTGQIISARVKHFSYEIGKDKIAVFAVFMVQKSSDETYKITKSEIDNDILNNWIERCKDVESRLEKLRSTNGVAVEKFSKLLHSYKEPKTIPCKNIIEVLTSDFKTCYMCRDPMLDLTKPDVVVNDKPFGKISVVKSTAGVSAMMMDYHDMMKCVCDMVELYNTQELLSEHENILRILHKNKI